MSDWHSYSQASAKRFWSHYLIYTSTHSQLMTDDLNALEAELTNLLLGVEQAYEHEDWDAVLDYTHVLCRPERGYLGLRGYWSSLHTYLSWALDAAQHKGDFAQEAAVWQQMALLAMNQGQLERSRELCTKALGMFQQISDDRGTAETRGFLATLARMQGDYEQARTEFMAVMQIFERLNDYSNMAVTYNHLGRLAEVQRDGQSAFKYYQEDLSLEQSLGNEWGVALALWGLGNAAYLQNDLKEALRNYEKAWDCLTAIGDKRNIAGLLGQMANLNRRLGDDKEAERLFLLVIDLCQELGEVITESLALFNLAELYHDRGELTRVVPLLERVVAIDEQAGLSDLEMDREALKQVRIELAASTNS